MQGREDFAPTAMDRSLLEILTEIARRDGKPDEVKKLEAEFTRNPSSFNARQWQRVNLKKIAIPVEVRCYWNERLGVTGQGGKAEA